MENLEIKFKKTDDGNVIIPVEVLDALVNSNNECLADIQQAVNHITRLLTDFDVINKTTGEFQQPSIGRITGKLTSTLMGGNSFNYLTELKPMLIKYATLNQNNQITCQEII